MKITKEFLTTVYIVKNNKVLLTFNNKVKNFVSIGGHIDKNELPTDAAIREVKEETGFDVELVNPRNYGRKEMIQNLDMGVDIIKPDHHHINISYIARIISGEQSKKTDEGAELRWFSIKELKNPNLLGNVRGASLKAIKIMSKNGS